MTVELSDEDKAVIEAQEAAKKAQEAEDAAKVKAEDDAKKKAEADAAAKAEATKPSSTNGMSEEQIVALEKSTGFNRNQLAVIGYFVNAALNTPENAKVYEKQAIEDAGIALKKDGIADYDAYKEKVAERLAKLPIEQRKNTDKIREVYYIIKGEEVAKKMSGKSEDKSKPKIMNTGVENKSGGKEDKDDNGEGIESLEGYSKSVAERYGIKTMKEWKKFQNKELDNSQEENWKPDFGRK